MAVVIHQREFEDVTGVGSLFPAETFPGAIKIPTIEYTGQGRCEKHHDQPQSKILATTVVQEFN